jgi:hypothetical protein
VGDVGVLASITDRILTLPGWLVLALVVAFPALEASAFVGFVFPGEIAVILGGVVASQGRVPLWAVIAAAVSGARGGLRVDPPALRWVRLRTVPVADRGPLLVPARPGGAPQVDDGANERHQAAGFGVHPNEEEAGRG